MTVSQDMIEAAAVSSLVAPTDAPRCLVKRIAADVSADRWRVPERAAYWGETVDVRYQASGDRLTMS